jgi:hypothetical protein
LFGQDHALANPSQPPEKAKHQAMNATSGPLGLNLSELADRQSSLANRLKRQLDGAGSTLFTLTWRKKATPLGRPYYQLAASGLPIAVHAYGSSPPTLLNRDYRHGMSQAKLEARMQNPRGVNLNEFMQRAIGRPGKLSPAFGLSWMGYPQEWLNCAPQAMRLSRKSRQSSSKPPCHD